MTEKQEETCENCGKPEKEHFIGLLGNARTGKREYCYQDASIGKKFKPVITTDTPGLPKNHSQPEGRRRRYKHTRAAQNHSSQTANEGDKLMGELMKEKIKLEGTQNHKKGCGKKSKFGRVVFVCGKNDYLCSECQEKFIK